MSGLLIVLITIASCAVVGGVFGWLWTKFLKGKEITPYLEWIISITKFILSQFDFVEKALVLKVLGYVQEAYKLAEQVSELTDFEAKVNYVIDKALSLAEEEGVNLDEYPMLESLIAQAAELIVTYWTQQQKQL